MLSRDISAIRYVRNEAAFTPETRQGAEIPVSNLQGWQAAVDEIHSWPEYSALPLHRLQNAAKDLGVGQIYLKDESTRFGKEMGSFKALGAPFTVACLLADEVERKSGLRPSTQQLRSGTFKAITERLTVCVATDGNQGRGLAYGAKVFGCRCVNYIHAHVSSGRKEAMEAMGAVVIRIDGEYEASVRRAKEDARLNGWHFVSSTSWDDYASDIPRRVMSAYMVMVDETLNALSDAKGVTHVLMQGGVGSIAAAVFLGFYQKPGRPCPRFVMIEPTEADCLLQSAKHGEPRPSTGSLHTIAAGLACREVSPAAWKILHWLVTDFVSIPDSCITQGMKYLAQGNEDIPIVCGESSAGAMGLLIHAANDASLRESLGIDQSSRIVVFGCEGATDPTIYRDLVGSSAESVFERQASYLAGLAL